MGVLIPGISLALSYLRQLAAAKSWGATKRQAKNSRYQNLQSLTVMFESTVKSMSLQNGNS